MELAALDQRAVNENKVNKPRYQGLSSTFSPVLCVDRRPIWEESLNNLCPLSSIGLDSFM